MDSVFRTRCDRVAGRRSSKTPAKVAVVLAGAVDGDGIAVVVSVWTKVAVVVALGVCPGATTLAKGDGLVPRCSALG